MCCYNFLPRASFSYQLNLLMFFGVHLGIWFHLVGKKIDVLAKKSQQNGTPIDNP